MMFINVQDFYSLRLLKDGGNMLVATYAQSGRKKETGKRRRKKALI